MQEHESVRFQVIGFTDDREVPAEAPTAHEPAPAGPGEVAGEPPSQETRDQALSRARAQAVVAYLIKRGVGHWRLEASGRGRADPVADNESRQGRSRNRRVELQVRVPMP